jgi:hypothetical protein
MTDPEKLLSSILYFIPRFLLTFARSLVRPRHLFDVPAGERTKPLTFLAITAFIGYAFVVNFFVYDDWSDSLDAIIEDMRPKISIWGLLLVIPVCLVTALTSRGLDKWAASRSDSEASPRISESLFYAVGIQQLILISIPLVLYVSFELVSAIHPSDGLLGGLTESIYTALALMTALLIVVPGMLYYAFISGLSDTYPRLRVRRSILLLIPILIITVSTGLSTVYFWEKADARINTVTIEAESPDLNADYSMSFRVMLTNNTDNTYSILRDGASLSYACPITNDESWHVALDIVEWTGSGASESVFMLEPGKTAAMMFSTTLSEEIVDHLGYEYLGDEPCFEVSFRCIGRYGRTLDLRLCMYIHS